jgi:hypothetical protein
MSNFSIKDLLIHILHGGVILCVIIIAFDITPAVELFNKKIAPLGTSVAAFTATMLFVICYLLGLFLDAIADCADTALFKRKKTLPFFAHYPSYDLLNKGECRHLKLAYHINIRKELSKDAMANDNEIIEKKCKCCNKEIWECEDSIMLLFNYAKSKASRNATSCQIASMDAYFGLFIFFRNMIATTLICIAIFLISLLTGNICCCQLAAIILASPPLMLFFYKACYKYRTYYCRTILGATYPPKKDN